MYFWNLIEGWIYILMAALALIACLIVVEVRLKDDGVIDADQASAIEQPAYAEQTAPEDGASEPPANPTDTTAAGNQDQPPGADPNTAAPESQAKTGQPDSPAAGTVSTVGSATENPAQKQPAADSAVVSHSQSGDPAAGTQPDPAAASSPAKDQSAKTLPAGPATTGKPSETAPEEAVLAPPLDRQGKPLVLCAPVAKSATVVASEPAAGLAHETAVLLSADETVRLVAAGRVLKINRQDPKRGLTLYIGFDRSKVCAIYGGLTSLANGVEENAPLACGAALGQPAEADDKWRFTFAMLAYEDQWYAGSHIDPAPFLATLP